jgi:hypothetical protein
MIATAESLTYAVTTVQHSVRSTSIAVENNTTIDDILKARGQSVHQPKAVSFLLT